MADWTPDDNDRTLVRVGMAAIGAAVRAARLELGSSQHTLARQAGVSQPVISRLESGRLTGIRWQTLARIIGVVEARRGFRLPRE